MDIIGANERPYTDFCSDIMNFNEPHYDTYLNHTDRRWWKNRGYLVVRQPGNIAEENFLPIFSCFPTNGKKKREFKL